jgi:hypothetical protein
MRIYFGLQEDKATVRELEKSACAEVVLLAGDFQQFLTTVPAEALYLPFSFTGQWNVAPKVHESQLINVQENLKQRFGDIPFILTPAALADSDPRTADTEAQVLFDYLLVAMKKKHIASLAIWAGFFSARLSYSLCIQKLVAAVQKVKSDETNLPERFLTTNVYLQTQHGGLGALNPYLITKKKPTKKTFEG